MRAKFAVRYMITAGAVGGSLWLLPGRGGSFGGGRGRGGRDESRGMWTQPPWGKRGEAEWRDLHFCIFPTCFFRQGRPVLGAGPGTVCAVLVNEYSAVVT